MRPENEQIITARLADIKRLSGILAEEDKACHKRIEAVKTEYKNRTTSTKTALDVAEKQLVAHIKRNKLDIFPGKTDRVAVAGGVLIHQIGEVVRKARHITVAFLREKGLRGAIRTEEHVDWQKISSWPDDRLALVGTDRRKKESFAYELTGE